MSFTDYGYILNHEIQHYKHHDFIIKILCELISAVYWWNPLVALLKQQISKSLEFSVDYNIVSKLCDSEISEYLECLLSVAKNTIPKYSTCSLTFVSENTLDLKQRVKYILHTESSSQNILIRILLTCLLLIILSFSIVIEPHYDYSNVSDETFALNDTSYFIQKDDTYYLYSDGEFKFSTSSIADELYSDIPVY